MLFFVLLFLNEVALDTQRVSDPESDVALPLLNTEDHSLAMFNVGLFTVKADRKEKPRKLVGCDSSLNRWHGSLGLYASRRSMRITPRSCRQGLGGACCVLFFFGVVSFWI